MIEEVKVQVKKGKIANEHKLLLIPKINFYYGL